MKQIKNTRAGICSENGGTGDPSERGCGVAMLKSYGYWILLKVKHDLTASSKIIIICTMYFFDLLQVGNLCSYPLASTKPSLSKNDTTPDINRE